MTSKRAAPEKPLQLTTADVLMDYAAPLLSDDNSSNIEQTLRAAMLMWNASFLPEATRMKLRDAFAEGSSGNNPATYALAMNMFQVMIQRRISVFGNANFMIKDIKMLPTGKGMRLQVWPMPVMAVPDNSSVLLDAVSRESAPGA